MIREPSFKIDEQLIIAQIKDYKKWLNASWFEKEANCEKFMNHFIETLENECNSINDLKQMLSVMDMLKFNEPFIKLMSDTQYVRHSLNDSISIAKNQKLSTSEIIDVFKESQYPIEEQLFKIPSKTDKELEKVKMSKLFLEEELQRKNERIEDLETQNDRLMKEVKYLHELSQKNDRVQALESQNAALLQQLQNIHDSKMVLAENANKTIDELRSYLLEYQNAVINKINQNLSASD